MIQSAQRTIDLRRCHVANLHSLLTSLQGMLLKIYGIKWEFQSLILLNCLCFESVFIIHRLPYYTIKCESIVSSHSSA